MKAWNRILCRRGTRPLAVRGFCATPRTLATKCFAVTSLCLCVTYAAEREQDAPSPERRLVTVEWTEVFRTTANHVLQITSIEGMPEQSIGVLEERGRVLRGGDIATLTAWLTYEDRAGSVSYKGYVRYRFPDGATMFATFVGDGQAPGSQKGNISFINGTGRFKGIKGTLAFTAAALSRLTLEGRYTMDVTGQYSLPLR